MTLTIDTDHKTILFSGCDMAEAVHFARLHEFDGYTVKKGLPAYSVKFAGTFNNPESFNPDEVFRGILAKEDPEYLESEVIPEKQGLKWHEPIKYKVKMTGGFIDYPEGHEGESILKFK